MNQALSVNIVKIFEHGRSCLGGSQIADDIVVASVFANLCWPEYVEHEFGKVNDVNFNLVKFLHKCATRRKASFDGIFSYLHVEGFSGSDSYSFFSILICTLKNIEWSGVEVFSGVMEQYQYLNRWNLSTHTSKVVADLISKLAPRRGVRTVCDISLGTADVLRSFVSQHSGAEFELAGKDSSLRNVCFSKMALFFHTNSTANIVQSNALSDWSDNNSNNFDLILSNFVIFFMIMVPDPSLATFGERYDSVC